MIKKFFCVFVAFFLSVSWGLQAAPPSLGAQNLSSTEADPEAIIDHRVNVINGDYCEVVTDLVIKGPDDLVLQRYFSNSNYVTGEAGGAWRIFPQCWLTVGKDPKDNSCTISGTKYDWTYAFTGERSGSILTYSGWESRTTKDEGLRVWAFRDGRSICNTARGEISGKLNPQNALLKYQNDSKSYTLTLGDGTRRFFESVDALPSRYLGEELHVDLSDKVKASEQYRLTLEILPSGNRLRYSYDLNGHLKRVEMRNASEKKVLSWINLEHQVGKKRVVITTSDQRQISYHLSGSLITQAHYSDQPEQSYTYDDNGKLTQKLLPGKPLQVEYDVKGRVACLKEPLDASDQLHLSRLFSYGDGFTEVQNALGHKTRYQYSKKEQLEAIERYDALGVKYRVDRRFWETKREQCCLLVAKTIEDGNGNTISCRRFSYDDHANVIEERLYGNLTGKSDAFLKMGKNGRVIAEEDDDCHVKKVEYSQDGFNLITKLGDCKGNETVFEYLPGTDRLVKELVKDNKKKKIQKRFFYSYNDDAVLIQTMEDDGSQEDPNKIYGWGVSERHITSIKPKEELPGVGLALEVLEQAAEYKDQFTPYQVKRVVSAYDTQGRIIKEDCYDADNVYRYSKTWDYDAHGNLIKETDQEGREILYLYDALDNCVLKQIPSQNITSEFSYDRQGRITEVRETYGATQQTLTNTYDLLGKKISSTDRKGNQTDFEYDSRGFLAKVLHPLMKDDKRQISRPAISYENDLFGNPLKTIDAKGYVMLKRFNLRGSPISIDYPDGTYELFKYDPEGSLHRHMTRDKIISIFEYDFLGRQVNEERSTAGKNGSGSWIDNTFCKYSTYHLESVKDKGAIVCYEYDGVGRLSKVYRPSKSYEEDDSESRKEEYTYDLLGRLSQKKIFYDKEDNDYFIEYQEYDAADRVVEKRIKDAQGVILQASRFIYDFRGLLIEEQSLLDGEYTARVKTAYNDLGEPTSIIDALGKETRFLYEDVSDDAGQTVLKKTIIDPSGVSTVMIFDAFHRMTSLTKLAPYGEVLSQQNIAYDLAGNKALEENLVISESTQNTQRTAWIFGPMNRIDEMHEAVGTEKERVTRYTYGEDGNLSEKLLPGMSSPITYTYSKEGKLYKIYYREGDDDDLQVSNRYSYDKRGNVTSAYSLGGKSVSRDYNAFDEVTRETIKDEGNEYSVHYEYDRLGRITLIRLPDGSKIQYSYDALYGKSVSRISPSGGLLYTHEYQDYDEWGRLKEEKMLGFLGVRKKEWDLGNQQISSECDYYKERVPQSGYDALGNLLQLHREGSFDPSDLSYVYNKLSQVTSEKGDAQQTYSYDSIGNRLNKNKEQYIYDPLNQLLKTPQDHYEYDPRGCLSKRSRNGVEWKFESNVLGQLVRIQKHDKALDFSYGPFGRRLTKKHLDVSGKYKKKLSVSRYLYLGEQEIGVIEESGEISELRVPGLAQEVLSQESISFEIQGHTLVPLYDMRGNVAALLDPQWREVVESYSYSSFGEEKIFDAYGDEIEESAFGNSWRYSGKRQDAETGFSFFGFRFYDPIVGRWISPDPALFVDGPNLYAFAQNNPLHYLDRFGFNSENRNSQEFDDYFYGEVESHCFCERHRTCKRGGDLGQMLTYGRDANLILFADHFEDSFENKSRLYDLSAEGEFQELSKGMIGFINGIDTSFEDFQSHLRHIGSLAGGYNVHGTYNATHGKAIDAYEYALNRLGVATPPVRRLHEKWDAFFAKADPGVPILQICHSQGAVLLRNALMSYPVELRKRIIVVAVAPGAYISKRLCKDVTHYITKWNRDIVPWLDPRGWRNERYKVVSLEPAKGAPGFDHSFQSPTYENAILEETFIYLQKYRS